MPRKIIVFIDDDAAVRTALTALLEMFGFEVRDFDNGADAIDAIDAALPDAVLVDINMPGMDGFEVARRLRASRHTANLHLVALTAITDEVQRSRATTAGFDVFLTKPASGQTILDALTPKGEADRRDR